VGAVIGRESRTAVCLMHRNARFAAKDRSYRIHAPVGAVIGRESRTAVQRRFKRSMITAINRIVPRITY
jgi:hypothetical protein